MQYQTVTISRSEHHSHTMKVVAWEVPLLQALYGAERVELGDVEHLPRRDKFGNPKPIPSAQSEFDRLVTVYKQTTEDGSAPLAHQVFGPPPRGIERLAEAMGETPRRRGPGRPRKDAEQEALIGELLDPTPEPVAEPEPEGEGFEELL